MTLFSLYRRDYWTSCAPSWLSFPRSRITGVHMCFVLLLFLFFKNMDLGMDHTCACKAMPHPLSCLNDPNSWMPQISSPALLFSTLKFLASIPFLPGTSHLSWPVLTPPHPQPRRHLSRMSSLQWWPFLFPNSFQEKVSLMLVQGLSEASMRSEQDLTNPRPRNRGRNFLLVTKEKPQTFAETVVQRTRENSGWDT